VKRLFLVAFFLEVGFILIVLPWSAYWDRNYFAQSFPLVHSAITNNFVRGAVSGVGIVNIAAGIGELISLLLAPRRTDDPPRIHVPHQTAED
jgi:hypothetical protein